MRRGPPVKLSLAYVLERRFYFSTLATQDAARSALGQEPRCLCAQGLANVAAGRNDIAVVKEAIERGALAWATWSPPLSYT